MSWHNRNIHIVPNIPPLPERPFSSKTSDLIALEKKQLQQQQSCSAGSAAATAMTIQDSGLQQQEHNEHGHHQHVFEPEEEDEISLSNVHVPSDIKDSHIARFTVMMGCNSAIDDKEQYGYTWPLLAATDYTASMETPQTTPTPRSVFFVGRPGLRTLCGTRRSIDFLHNPRKRSVRLATPELDKDPVYFDPAQSRNFFTTICPCYDVCFGAHTALVHLGPRLWPALITMDVHTIPELSRLCELLRYNVLGWDNDDTIYDAEKLLAEAPMEDSSTGITNESSSKRIPYRV